MVEKQIAKLFCEDKELYSNYYKYLNLEFIKTNYTNLYKLFISIDSYYNKYNTNSITKEQLEISYNNNYLLQSSERQELKDLIDEVFYYNTEEITEPLIELLRTHKTRCLAGSLAKIALDVEDGNTEIQKLFDKFLEFEQDDIEDDKPEAITTDLADLYQSQVAESGLRWRLNWLNKSMGSLRQGDFGFIFARPETGKTTFLASEVTNMVAQTDKDIIWFNNEEQGKKVAIRCYQALLGLETQQLFSDIPHYAKQYMDITEGRIKIFDFNDSSNAKRIEAVLKQYNPGLIIFDQIDKIKGFKADRNDLELKAIYQWARELSKQYGPVIAVSQAGGEAEGKLWLTMDMVDSSKTAKQGEADWILGIGKEQDNTSRRRYLNISKNKLLGDTDSLPDLRHGQTQVIIQPEVARYAEI